MKQDKPLPVLLFDGDCAFCTLCAAKAEKWLRLMHVEPWQFADLDALGVSQQQCESALQWIDVDGGVSSGHIAISAAMRSRGAMWGVAGRVLRWPVVTQLASLTYQWVAKNRHRLPGGTAACEVREASSPR